MHPVFAYTAGNLCDARRDSNLEPTTFFLTTLVMKIMPREVCFEPLLTTDPFTYYQLHTAVSQLDLISRQCGGNDLATPFLSGSHEVEPERGAASGKRGKSVQNSIHVFQGPPQMLGKVQEMKIAVQGR